MIGPIAAKTPSAGVTLASPSASPSTLPRSSPVVSFDPAALSRDIEAAQSEAEALAQRLRDGAKANANAAKAARLDLARARLKALRLVAALKAVLGDGRGALKVAEEAARVARDIEGLRAGKAPAETGTAAPGSTTEAPAATVSAAVEAEADPAVDALLQTARKIIAMARRAARPGSPEDRAMESLQRGIGVPQIATDIDVVGDLVAAAGGRTGVDLKV